MNVELPSTGCNVLQSSTTFYNYSPDARTRSLYIIFDGEAHLRETTTSQYGYTYTGTCLSTGDLVYKPEFSGFWFPLFSTIVFCAILQFLYHLIIKRLMP